MLLFFIISIIIFILASRARLSTGAHTCALCLASTVAQGYKGECTRRLMLKKGELCVSLARMLEGISASRIQILNPNVNCGLNMTVDTPVCVATDINPYLSGCLGRVTLSKASTCADLASFYGITDDVFEELNPILAEEECVTGEAITAGTEVCVRDLDLAPPQCVVQHTFGATNNNDSCDAIRVLYSLTEAQLYALNRGLDCDALVDGDKVCVRDYAIARSPTPARCCDFFTPPENTTCQAVVDLKGISLEDLKAYNPTINCDSPVIENTMLCLLQEAEVPWEENLSVNENPRRIEIIDDLAAAVLGSLNARAALSGVAATVAAEEASIISGLLTDFKDNPTVNNNEALNSMLCFAIYPDHPELVTSISVDENQNRDSTCAFLGMGNTEEAARLQDCLCGANTAQLPLLYCLCGLFNTLGGHHSNTLSLSKMHPSRRLVAIKDSMRAVHSHAPIDWPGMDEHHRETQDTEVLLKSLNLVGTLIASPIAQALCGRFGGGSGPSTLAQAGRLASKIQLSATTQKIVKATAFAASTAKRAFIDQQICCKPEYCQPMPNFPFFSVCVQGGICLPKFALYQSNADGGVFTVNSPVTSACYANSIEASECYSEDAGCQSNFGMGGFLASRIATIELSLETKLCINPDIWPGRFIGIEAPCRGVGFCEYTFANHAAYSQLWRHGVHDLCLTDISRLHLSV